MPHKYRRRGPGKATDFDLPPATRAKSLPNKPLAPDKLLHNTSGNQINRDAAKKKPRNKRMKDVSREKHGQEDDDTPRAFARLMRFVQEGKRPPSGLDDGVSNGNSKSKPPQRLSKKRKRDAATTEEAPPPPPPPRSGRGAAQFAISAQPQAHQNPSEEALPTTTTLPPPPSTMKILPHERLSDFAARVDRSLPLSASAVPKKREKNKTGRPVTKHERRLRRLQTRWREEERQRREKVEAEQEDIEDQREEALLWGGAAALPGSVSVGKGKKKRRRRMEEEEDPWAEVARKRRKAMGTDVGTEREQKQKLRGLHDVVEAPPSRLEPVRARLKVKDRDRDGG